MDAGGHDLGRRLFVPRYNPFQRANHWLTAILFVLLAMSGLAMAYPGLFFLATPLGGGPLARTIHPWLGLVLAVSFYGLAIQFWRNNIPNRDDVRWARAFPSVMLNEHENLPELGKYNAGQKGVYWSQIVLIAIMLCSGVVIWQQVTGGWFSIPSQRIAVLVHSLAAVIAISVIIIHIYAGIWIRGTGRAMTRGSVTGGWAYLHHRKWMKSVLARGGPVRTGSVDNGGID